MLDLGVRLPTYGPARSTRAAAEDDLARARKCESRRAMLDFVRQLSGSRDRAGGVARAARPAAAKAAAEVPARAAAATAKVSPLLTAARERTLSGRPDGARAGPAAAARKRPRPGGPGGARLAAATAAEKAPAQTLSRCGIRRVAETAAAAARAPSARGEPSAKRARQAPERQRQEEQEGAPLAAATAADEAPAAVRPLPGGRREDPPFHGSHQLLDDLEMQLRCAFRDGDLSKAERISAAAREVRGQLMQFGDRASAPPPQQQSPPRQWQDEMMKDIKKLHDGGDSVDVPQVRIRKDVEGVKPQKKAHTVWPFKDTPAVSIEGFQQYMVPARVNEDTFHSRYSLGLRYLFRLLDIDKENYSDIGVVQALYDQGVMAKLTQLPIMDPIYHWTEKMTCALKCLIEFMLVQCEDKRLGPARKALTSLRDRQVFEITKACSRSKKLAGQARKDVDRERLRNYMPIAMARSTLMESMIDLRAVHRIHEGADSMTPFWQRVASVNMAWQMVMNGTFARSGELSNLYETEVLDSRAAGLEYVVIKRHKTVLQRGKLGRYFTPAMWRAVECYTSLPPLEGSTFTPENRPFLRPAMAHMKKTCVYDLLKIGGNVFCQNHTFPRTNLQRKWITGAVRKDENVEICKKWVAEYNAHSMSTAENVYWIEDVEEQATRTKTMVTAFFGAPVEWPSDDELAKETVEEAKARLLCKYGRAFKADAGGLPLKEQRFGP